MQAMWIHCFPSTTSSILMQAVVIIHLVHYPTRDLWRRLGLLKHYSYIPYKNSSDPVWSFSYRLENLAT